MNFAFLEAAVSCGSPSENTEFAFDALMALGIFSAFGEGNIYPMEKMLRCENYPQDLLYYDTVMAASRRLRQNMLGALENGDFPVVIGGDHSIAMGSLAALGEHYGAENVALVYIDAHADINTVESSASHYIHGMDLAAACGLCEKLQVGKLKKNIDGKNIYIIGARSIDPPEYGIMEQLGVRLYTAEDCRKRGLAAILDEIQLQGKHLHISFDVDVLDPRYFTSTGYLIPGGFSWDDVKVLLDALVPLCSSFECVEYNPTRDTPDSRDGKALVQFLAQYRDRFSCKA